MLVTSLGINQEAHEAEGPDVGMKELQEKTL